MEYCIYKADVMLEEYFHFEAKILKVVSSFAYRAKSETGMLPFSWCSWQCATIAPH